MSETESFSPSVVYIAADHGGFAAKQALAEDLAGDFTLEDLGPRQLDPTDDFTPYAEAVAEAVVKHSGSLGILLCRSGEGMSIAANKIDGVRAVVAWNETVARETRDDNDANVLALPADFASLDELKKIARTWLTTEFSGAERHARRVEQIRKLEDPS